MEISILKYDGKKEDNADPLIALWDLWLYRIRKAYRAMVHLLEKNWK